MMDKCRNIVPKRAILCIFQSIKYQQYRIYAVDIRPNLKEIRLYNLTQLSDTPPLHIMTTTILH